MTLRRLVELASRNRTFKRRMPARYGNRPLLVSPDASLRWLKPGMAAFEPRLLAIIENFIRPGMVAWDIGANVGLFAYPAAHLSRGKVVCVEPDPFLAQLLRRTSKLPANGDLDVEILCAAIGDRDGIARLRIAGRGRSTSGIEGITVSSQHGTTREVMTVPMLALDTLLSDFPPPQFLKIDIEGAELLLLAGASRVLSEVKPIILIEVNSATWPEASATLTAAGYELFDGDLPPESRTPATSLTCNLLAIPTDQ
jgi:FkbM family methyltransferase